MALNPLVGHDLLIIEASRLQSPYLIHDIVISCFAGHSNKFLQERVIVLSILIQGIKREEPERKFHKPGMCEKVHFFAS